MRSVAGKTGRSRHGSVHPVQTGSPGATPSAGAAGNGRSGRLDTLPSQRWLDVGCGEGKTEGAIGMDRRAVPGVDIVHDIEAVPWPFEDATFTRIIMSHVVEHLKPWLVIDIFNEMWRLLKPGGILMIATPYAGSFGFWQDPTHTKGWIEATPSYFDPEHASQLYYIYKPKPWQIVVNSWHADGNMEICLKKRSVNEKPAR